MKSVMRAPLLAAILLVFLALPRMDLGPLWLSTIRLLLGLSAVVVLEGEMSWLGIIAGALSPFLYAWTAERYAPLGVAGMSLLWLAPRIWRAQSLPQMGRLAGVSTLAAVLAGYVSTTFADADLTMNVAACLFSGAALVLTAVVFRVDSPSVHALLVASRSLTSPLRERVQLAVERKRQEELGLSNEKGRGRAWGKLLKDLDARIALNAIQGPQAQAAQKRLDDTLGEQLDALTGALEGPPQAGEPAASKPQDATCASEQKPLAESLEAPPAAP